MRRRSTIYSARAGGAIPENVLTVNSAATGAGDGSTWEDAFTSLTTALAAMSAAKTELWVTGNQSIVSVGSVKPATDIAVRGGFAGTEYLAADRVPGAKSIWTLSAGQRIWQDFGAGGYGLTLDGFVFQPAGGWRGVYAGNHTNLSVLNSSVTGSSVYEGALINHTGTGTLIVTGLTVTNTIVSSAVYRFISTAGNLAVTDSVFTGCTCAVAILGSGTANSPKTAVFTRVKIVNNNNVHSVRCDGSAPVYLDNCLFANNGTNIASMYCAGSVYIRESTLWCNASAVQEFYVFGGTRLQQNSIFRRNSPYPANAQYCCGPNLTGTGCITSDPLLDVDYAPGVGSPAINAGSNALVVGSIDILGNPRIVNGTVDQGCYEYQL